MNRYYIYAYLRDNGSPYYIGKGTDRRAWKPHSGVSVPKDTSRIVIMENNLTEIGALALERFYIRWYGRKDLDTGILRNLTDGGEGTSGAFRSDEWRQNLSKSAKGRSISEKTRKKMSESKIGRLHDEATKEKIRKANIGKGKTRRPMSDATKEKIRNALTGKSLSNETKQKISQAKRKQYNE